jgi:ethanolamine utilization protein EutN
MGAGGDDTVMQLGQVLGHATSTVKHPSLHGWRMLIVQPLDGRNEPDGVPIIALDALGSGRGDRVVISSDGKATREMVGVDNSPARWAVVGVVDERRT